MITLLHGDCREKLRDLADRSVQCIVTSPPYYGLRRYDVQGQQIGLEQSPAEYVAALVGVFRECRRVLRDDGVLWVNLGDSYAGSGVPGKQSETANLSRHGSNGYNPKMTDQTFGRAPTPEGMTVKNLIGIPWRVAFALQDDGWILRSDIIWSKPSPMPESVTDRPTRSHEYIFMFSKGKRTGPPARRFETFISDQDARWLALFLDTEGNISVKRAVSATTGRTWYGAQIVFASTSQKLLGEAHRIIGCGSVKERAGQNAPMFYLQLSNRMAADLLHRIYPYLIVKQRQARALIYLQDLLADAGQDRHSKVGQLRGRTRSDTYTAKLEQIWELNKSLNHFGDPDDTWIPDPAYGKWAAQPYYYDAQAIAEPVAQVSIDRINQKTFDQQTGGPKDYANGTNPARSMRKAIENFAASGATTRNRRTVWTVATRPYSGAHFAVFPEQLIAPCILAGSAAQACEVCGAPWGRVVEREGDSADRTRGAYATEMDRLGKNHLSRANGFHGDVKRATLGFRPTCACDALGTARSIVLDPFVGSGTTCRVAEKYGRDSIGIDLGYSDIQAERTDGIQQDMEGLL